ncbi:hypothetical protein MICRO8M_130214 [Microbacterium sp. 8M]|uniref:hypothetical protein n=1 Tax=Microbacterium sp. 8M TaxID=2653153 RepID=UPI0012F061F2|nr:hypothetical protein [Microbacterium sp. 8M]VXB45851.1 hypothetical protein MICRO8M_130214 [Microbacterium sp. 8M]
MQSAQKVIALQTSAVDRRASETVSQDIATEMTFYTASFSEALRKDGYADKTVALFEDAQLTTAPLSISWYVSTLSADRTTGRAEIDATFEFTRADDDFLAKNRLALDTPYTQHRTIDLVKQDGRWLISNITRAPLTRTEGNGQ